MCRQMASIMIIHLVYRMIRSPACPLTIKCRRDHRTNACPVIIGYQPIVRRKTASHRVRPVVMFMSLRRKPREYGRMPRLEINSDQK